MSIGAIFYWTSCCLWGVICGVAFESIKTCIAVSIAGAIVLSILYVLMLQ